MEPGVLFLKYHDDLNIRPMPRAAERTLQIYPPLGILCLASYLRQNGYDVQVLDAYALNLSDQEIVRRLQDARPGIIGISSTTIGWPLSLKAAQLARIAHPEAMIVIGGPQMSLFPEECLSFDCIDVGVYGDGEETILEILQNFAGGKPILEIPGTVVKENGKIRINPPRPFIKDLDRYPFPAFDLIPLHRYRCLTVEKPFLTMVTSRGCPYKCGFCTQVFCGDTVRFRSPESIADEIELYIKKYGVKEIVMFDETFTVNKQRVLRLCHLIGKRSLNFRFNIRTRVDTIDEEMMIALKEAGCYGLHMGIESGHPRILEIMRKGITLDQIRTAFSLARKHGFLTRGYFMIGYLDEDEETYRATVELARALPLDWASFSITTPLPHTHLFEEAVRRGLIRADYWKEYTLGRLPSDRFPHITTDRFGEDDLKRMMLGAYHGFYLRPSYVLRRLATLRSLRQLKDLVEGFKIMVMMKD